MNSLEELNFFSQGLIEFGDLRGPGLEWDKDPAVNQSLTIFEGQAHTVPVGAELLSIRNYQALNVYYQIDLTNLAGAEVSWPTLPVYITENPQVGQVYRVSGLSNTDDWALLKTTQITLPQNYSGTFTYTVTVGTILGVERSWTVTVTVLEVTLWEIGTFSRFMPLQHYFYDQFSRLKIRQTETTPFKMRHANIVDAGNVPGITYTVTISFNFPEIINAISTTYNGVNHNYTGNVSVNSTTKTITLSGSKQNINQTLGIYDEVQLATNPNYIPTYPGFNITYNVLPTKMDLIVTYNAVSSLGEEDTVKIHYITQPGPSVLVKDNSHLKTSPDKKGIFAGSYQTYTPNTPKTINSSYYIIPSTQSLPPATGDGFVADFTQPGSTYQDVWDLEIYAQPTTAISNISAVAVSSYNLYSPLQVFNNISNDNTVSFTRLLRARYYNSNNLNVNGNTIFVNGALHQPATKKISYSANGDFIAVANDSNKIEISGGQAVLPSLSSLGEPYQITQTIEINRPAGVSELPLHQVVMNGAGDRLVFNIRWATTQNDASSSKDWMNNRIYTYNKVGNIWTQSGFFEYTPGTLPEIEPFVNNNTNTKWMRFGNSMAISKNGNYLALTVLHYPNWETGTDNTRNEFSRDYALIYVYNAGVWQFQQKIVLTGSYVNSDNQTISEGTFYGGAHSVNLDEDGDTLVCSGKDMAHVFTRTGTTWSKQTTIVGPQKIDRQNNSVNSLGDLPVQFDRTPINISVGIGMQIQTSVKKFGTGATQSYPGALTSRSSLYVLNNDNFKFESNDFTIEMFITSAGQGNQNAVIVDFRKRLLQGTALRAGRLYAKYIQAGLWWITWAVNDQNTDTFSDKINTQFNLNVNPNTFKHLAVSRIAGVTRIFIDGVQRGPSYADNNNYTSNSIMFGNSIESLEAIPNPSPIGGTMDEIRVSRIGRYFTDFIPPTSAFVNDLNTRLLIHCDGANQSTSFVDDATPVLNINAAYKSVQSIDVNNNTITFTQNHNLTNGDRLVYLPASGVAPITGLIKNQEYFIRVITNNQIQLHNTKQNALFNINPVDISGALPGSGSVGVFTPTHFFGNFDLFSKDNWGSQCEISDDGNRIIIVAAGGNFGSNVFSTQITNGYIKIYDRISGSWNLTQTLTVNNWDLNASLSGNKNYLAVINSGFELNGIGYSTNSLRIYKLNSANQYSLQQQQFFSDTYVVKPYVVKLSNDSNNIIALGDRQNIVTFLSGNTNYYIAVPAYDYYRANLVYGYDSSTRKFTARGSSAAIGQMLNAITITSATGQTADYHLLYSVSNTYFFEEYYSFIPLLSAIGSEYWDNTGN